MKEDSAEVPYLPPELFELIIRKQYQLAKTPQDVRSLRAVCQSWRSLTPPPSRNLLSFVFPYYLKSSPPFLSINGVSILASNTYLLHSNSLTGLIRVEETTAGVVRVRKPLTHNESMESYNYLPKNLNSCEFRIIQLVYSGYSFNASWCTSRDKLLVYPSLQRESIKSNTTEAIVLFSGLLYLVNLEYDEKWKQLNYPGSFDDIIRFREVNYAVDPTGRLLSFPYVHQLQECRNYKWVSYPIVCDYSSGKESRMRLVEWRGELYLVRKDKYVIRVYKLNEKNRRWIEVDDLGGKLLFVATDYCFFAYVERFPAGWKGNTVIFHSSSFLSKGEKEEDPKGLYLYMCQGCKYESVSSSYPWMLESFWPITCT